jgi:hypothetical protein
MKRLPYLLASLVTVVAVGTASAEPTGPAASGDNAAIIQAIEAQFKVTNVQIAALRSDQLGYGEIVILLGLAAQEPGGVTPTSIDEVLAVRQGPPVMGWGQIANQLGLTLQLALNVPQPLGDAARRALGAGGAAGNPGAQGMAVAEVHRAAAAGRPPSPGRSGR